jgi:hypothetical protein
MIFESEEEIQALRKNAKKSFAVSIIRNSLGVVKSEDWIFRLSIGNIIDLSFLTIPELSG